MVQVPLLRLECGCNSYEWGKVGHKSAAAKFAAATNFKIEDDKPYAELWMGTHPSLPSKDFKTGRSLLDIADDNQSLMGSDVIERYGNKVPFLFKVLSITKALSIQAHPNKKLAEKLHAKDSKNYPDDNHKPEMAIAITPFEGLCGFRPLAEISHFLKTVKPLRSIVGDSAADAFVSAVKDQESTTDEKKTEENKKVLQTAFSALMKNGMDDTSALETATKELVKLAKEEGDKFAGGGAGPTSGKELAALVDRLNSQFPNDIGLLILFFLNYVQLEVGEAMFLKADDIHGYLSGDIMECMASSDNVVRAGFTPKFKDVSTLTDMLTYSYAPISEQKMDPQDYPYVKLDQKAYSSNSSAILYDPPIDEFSVVKTDLKSTGAKATFESIDGPSIVICASGSGKISVGSTVEEMKTGYVYFVGATAELVLESASDETFVTFKAFCELQGKESAKKNGNL